MNRRHLAVLALAVLAVGGCKKKEPAPAPVPAAQDDAALEEARRRARADSIAAAEAARREAEERARAAELARVRESLTDVVYFDYDSEALTAEAEARLRDKIAILRANPSLEVRVAGHADQRGSTEYNLALGQRRAQMVRDYLARYGIDGARVSTISYGEERPAVEGETERAYAQNRRAEFAVVSGDITTLPGTAR